MKAMQQNPHKIELSSCILNILWVIDLALTLSNTSCGMYSIPEESKYTTLFLSMNTKTQCVFLIYLSLRFMTYAPSIILSKLSLKKT